MAVLIAGATFGADEPWKTKPFQQWTEKDIDRILSSSPWVRSIVLPAGDSPGGFGGSTGLEGPPGRGPTGANNPNNPNSPPSLQQGEQQEAQPSTRTFYIFWQSSKTMRAAVAQRAVLQSKMSEADAEKYVDVTLVDYQVVVQGQNMRIFQDYDEKYTQEGSFLKFKKSKEKVSPSKVEFQKAPDGDTITAVIFSFPKKLPSGSPLILPDEKSIEFTCKLGGFTLDTSFDPQKMKNQAGPDL
ncbi:MAG TPA: hypothetical protein VMU43_11650 [Candidatus Acidoferrum sp.]|nr:hypothetical protein [Candidatus Acidoferrum sp.]